MALELFYTSVPRGLVPGSTGFCTVGYTAGMTSPMIQKLESLSGYRPIFQLGSPDEAMNPEEFAHWRPVIGGYPFSVLSRVRFAGADDSGRLNKFAHHIVLEAHEQAPAGPAWVMMQPDVMASEWIGDPRILSSGKALPAGDNPPRRCEAWERAAGDAGWAGVLVEAFLLDASKPAYVIYPLGTDVLALLNEAIALLPERQRWNVTFSTYFASVAAGMTCTWRCCVEGTPAAKAAPGMATSGVVINLSSMRGPPRETLYVTAARSGTPPPETAAMGDQRIAAPASSGGGWQSGGGAFSSPEEKPDQWDELLEQEGKATAALPTPAGRGGKGRWRRWPSGIFWAVAILWPILVLALGWLAWQKYKDQPAPPTPVASATAKESVDLKKAYDDKLLAAMKKISDDAKEHEKALQILQTEKTKTERLAGKLAGELEIAYARLKQLEVPQVASATPDVAKPANEPKAPPPANGGSTPPVPTGPAIAKLVPGIPGLYAAEYPKLKVDVMGRTNAKPAPVELVKKDRADKIDVAWPVEWRKQWPFRISSQADPKKIVIEWAYKDAVGREKVETLCEAYVERGSFCWQWGDIKDPIKVNRELLENLVRYAMWSVSDAGDTKLASVQLVVPQEIPLTLNSQTAPPKLVNPGFDATRQMQVPLLPEGWTAKPLPGALEIISPSQVVLTLRLESGSKDVVHVRAFWPEGRRPQDFDKRIAEIKANLPEQQKQLATLKKAHEEARKSVESIEAEFYADPEMKKLADELKVVSAKIEEARKKLPKNEKGEIDWESRKDEKQFNEWDAAPHQRKKELEQILDGKRKPKLGAKPQELAAVEANLGRKKTEMETENKELAGFAAKKADVAKFSDLKVLVLVPNSGVVLARIQLIP
jgi:hypothetical protein